MKRLPLFLLILLVVACSSIDCPVENTVATHYYIYNSDGTALTLTDTLTVRSVRNDGKNVILYRSDSVVYNRGVDIQDFQIPISYSHPEDILFFNFFNASKDSLFVIDTVWVKKEDIPHFESVDCNASFFHRLTDVRHTRHYIDSIVISNPSVDYDQKTEHFRLYPKTSK